MTRRNDEDWIGNATMLLSELVYDAETLKIDTKSKYWPKGANSLSRRLKEIKVNLQQVGIEIEFGDDGTQRIITMRKISLIPLIPLVNGNQARIDSIDTNDTNDNANGSNDIPLVELEGNHAQNCSLNDTNDTNDTIHTVKCPDCDEKFEPYYMKFHTQNTGHRDWSSE